MAIPGVGVDKLVETGKLDHLKDGPLFWVDSADSHPCMGNENEGYHIYHIHENFCLTKTSPCPATFVLQKYLVE